MKPTSENETVKEWCLSPDAVYLVEKVTETASLPDWDEEKTAYYISDAKYSSEERKKIFDACEQMDILIFCQNRSLSMEMFKYPLFVMSLVISNGIRACPDCDRSRISPYLIVGNGHFQSFHRPAQQN